MSRLTVSQSVCVFTAKCVCVCVVSLRYVSCVLLIHE